jgi:hypothetical protein
MNMRFEFFPALRIYTYIVVYWGFPGDEDSLFLGNGVIKTTGYHRRP